MMPRCPVLLVYAHRFRCSHCDMRTTGHPGDLVRPKMLGTFWGLPCQSERRREQCSQSGPVWGLAWVVGAVHVGVEKNAEMCRELALIKCKNVVAVDCGGVGILQEGAKMIACAGEVFWIWWGVEGVLPCAVVMQVGA